MDRLTSQFNDIYALPADELITFLGLWTRIELPKGNTLLSEGEISQFLYFVESGSIRCFSHAGGKEITEWIALEQTFMFSPISLFSSQPGRLSFQTVENATVFSINIADLEAQSAKSIHMAQFYRLLITRALMAAQRRIEALLVSSANQRYKNLIREFPGILNRIPLSYLASYIGITKETLSRVRARRTPV